MEFSQYQKNDSVLCGYYCIHIIKELNKGFTPFQIPYSFEQKPNNYNENKVIDNGLAKHEQQSGELTNEEENNAPAPTHP